MFIEHDLQNNTFCNVFMPFYSCRTYVVYGTTVNMWITWNLTLTLFYILIYNKRKGDNLVAWSHGPKAYHPLDRILNK